MTKFEYITSEDGISQAWINSIMQDDKGFMWFASFDGLNRYDGYKFKIFRHDPNDDYSLSHNFINSIYKDSNGRSWIATRHGLNLFDAQTERFQRFYHQSDDENSLSHNNVFAIVEDLNGMLWFGTADGLNLYDADTKQFKRFFHHKDQKHSLIDNRIQSLAVDVDGRIWVGTKNGLDRLEYNHRSGEARFIHFKADPKRLSSLSHDQVQSLFVDSANQLWVGTLNGLNRYNAHRQSFVRFYHVPDSAQSISHNNIKHIFEDDEQYLWISTYGGGITRMNLLATDYQHFRQSDKKVYGLSDDNVWFGYQDRFGSFWFGTRHGGINKLDRNKGLFNHVYHQPFDNESITNNSVRALYKDSKGRVWVGTDFGLNRYLPQEKKYRRYLHQIDDPHSLSHNSIFDIFEDSQGRIWLGTMEGLLLYRESSDDFERLFFSNTKVKSLSDNYIHAIVEDKYNQLWLGTWGGGLIRFDVTTGQFQRYRSDANNERSLASDFISDIAIDSGGKLWLATFGGGLNRLDVNSGHFKRYQHQAGDPLSLSDNSLYSLWFDQQDDIWIGSLGGLNHFERLTEQFSHFRESDGLANDNVYGVVGDKLNGLWLSTNKGLSRFDLAAKTFRNFDRGDGLQGEEYNSASYHISLDGEIFMGGVNGFNRFYPKQVLRPRQQASLVLTELLVANQPVAINPNGDKSRFTIPKQIDSLQRLILDYKQQLISIEFASLHFIQSASTQYAYQLQGMSEDWIYTDRQHRRATFMNLSPGHYLFKVRTRDQNGQWLPIEKTLQITVIPPPWRTWWAFSIYTLLFLGLLMAYFYMRGQHRSIQQQTQINERLTELDKLKDVFLATTSHELRTPIHGIIGLAESLLDGVAGQLPEKANHSLTMVATSGRRLTNLINDILDFSKLKYHKLNLNLVAVDLHSMVDVVLSLDAMLVANKSVKLKNLVDKNLPPVLADEDRLCQILHNLVGNGIKFTEQGEVSVSAKIIKNNIIIRVKDTGIGVSKDQFDRIFSFFEQQIPSDGTKVSGTGLGLVVTKQLVELHGSKIRLRSEVGKGSCFSFSLKISNERPLKTKNRQLLARLKPVADIHVDDGVESNFDASFHMMAKSWKILIVDDEAVNRMVIRNHLSTKQYELIEASDSEQALDILLAQGPFDLVLLDIMMPKISGYELCSRIRQQYTACELPIIVLTARNQVNDLVDSFAVGANDYLTKPVSKPELLSRVANHLKYLDIHRNLEDRVSERTLALEQKTREIMTAQQQLVQAEKMAALGTLTAGVAHEINNPINFVHVSAHNLTEDLIEFQQYLVDLAGENAESEVLDIFAQKFELLRNHLATIEDGTERVKLIVKDLSAFTQVGEDKQKMVKVSKLIRATVNLVRIEFKNSCDFMLDFADEPQVLCVPSQLNQVFMNIVVNACQAVSRKHSDSHSRGLVDISSRIEQDTVRIEISDNGCGMNEQTRSKLFEPFYTTNKVGEGTGLGLSISYDIMQKHGGSIAVESQLDEGSCFILKLPKPQQD